MMRDHKVIAVVASVTLVLLAGIGLVNYTKTYQNAAADEKAAQLTTELTAAGLPAPPPDRIAAVLGPDGGTVCLDPDDALRRGILHGRLTNGAAGPGQRPVIADYKVVHGQLLIIKVYCPEYIDDFQRVIDNLRFAEVAG
jgi:hypothetical protein